MLSRMLLTGALIAALAGTAAAQRGGGGGRNRGGDMGAPFTPAEMNRMDQMTAMLKLNKEQKKQVKETMDEGQKEALPLHEQLTKSRDDIAAAVQAGKSQDEVNQAVKACADVESHIANIELKSFAQIYNLLDADQRAKTRPVFMMMSGVFDGKNWTTVQ